MRSDNNVTKKGPLAIVTCDRPELSRLLRAIVLGLALIVAATAARTQPAITKVTVTKDGDGALVRVEGRELAKPRVARHNAGKAWVASFDASLRTEPKFVSLKAPLVRYVQYGWYTSKPPVVNVLAWVDPKVQPTLQQEANGWLIRIGKAEPVKSEPAPKPAKLQTVPKLSPDPTAPTTEKTSPTDSRLRASDNRSKNGTQRADAPEGGIDGQGEKNALRANDTHKQRQPEVVKKAQGETEGWQTTSVPSKTGTQTRNEVSRQNVERSPTNKAAEKAADTARTLEYVGAGHATAQQPVAPVRGPTQPPRQEPKVTLEFPKADVVTVLRALAPQLGANIITAPDVKGEISVSMRNEDAKTALDLITTMAGYRYKLIGRTYVVGTSEFLDRFQPEAPGVEPATREYVTEQVMVSAPPDEVVKLLAVLAPSVKATPGISTGRPSVVLQGHRAEVERAKSELAKHVSPDEVIEIYTAKYRDSHDLKTYFQPGKSLVPGVTVMVGPSALGSASKVTGKKTEEAQTTTKAPKPGQAETASTESVEEQTRVKEEKPILPEIGPTVGDERKLVLKGPRAAVEKALEVLAVLDIPLDEVTEIYVAKHLSSRSLQNLFMGTSQESGESEKSTQGSPLIPGVKLTEGPASVAPLARGTTKIEAEPSRHLLVTGPRTQVDHALALLSQLDVPEPQVVIEAKVMDVLRDDLDKLGIKWDLFDSGAINIQHIERQNTSKTQQNVRDGTSQITDTVGNNTFEHRNQDSSTDDWRRTFETLGDPIVNLYNLSFNPKTFIGSVNAILDALVVSKRSKLLASPKVSALDGRPARIFIGDVVKYIEQISQTPQGQSISVGEVEAGILLNAVPRVSPDGSVTLSLKTDVSLITAFNDVPGGGKLPQVASRNVETNIRMRDGETIVIAGLIREEELQTMTKVPLLGDLPFLGQLFRHRSKTKTGSEVVLFLTVRVVQE